MNCICDDFRFPPETTIYAGLTDIPRQIGTFAEFRRALLHAISIRSTANLRITPLVSPLLDRARPRCVKRNTRCDWKLARASS
jgi:hypothetical protein